MTRLQFSLLGLFGVMTFAGLGCAAMVQASLPWCAGVFVGTVVLLLNAVPRAIYRRGAERAFWIGFAVFGWGYMVVLYGPLCAMSGQAGISQIGELEMRFVDELWNDLYGIVVGPLPPGNGGARGGGGFMAVAAEADGDDSPSDEERTGLQVAVQANAPPPRVWPAAPPRFPPEPIYFAAMGNLLSAIVLAWIGGVLSRAAYLRGP